MLAKKDRYSDSGQIIANRGERVYHDLYQDAYESKFPGQYVVIEVLTKRAYVSESAAGAVTKAKTDDPNGLFHFIEIQEAPKGITFYFRKLVDFLSKIDDIKLS